MGIWESYDISDIKYEYICEYRYEYIYLNEPIKVSTLQNPQHHCHLKEAHDIQ